MKSKEKIVWICQKNLAVDPRTRRKYYDEETKQRLVEDMKENRFKEEHPLVVRPNGEKRGHWLITCGQNRFEAGVKAGIGYFPCIRRRTQNDREAITEAYRDNILRSDPDPITEAEYFEKIGICILKEEGHTDKTIERLKRKMPVERIAIEMGVPPKLVEHRLKLLKLPSISQKMVSRYYMKNARGYKLNPAVGEALVKAFVLLRGQFRDETKAELETVKLGYKFSVGRVGLKEARAIVADIAFKGYDKWKTAKIVVDEQGMRCFLCGKKTDDYPWMPFCTECKSRVYALQDEDKNQKLTESMERWNEGKGDRASADRSEVEEQQ